MSQRKPRRAGGQKRSAAARAWQLIGLFLALVVAVYVLVGTTGDKSFTPKLGIDLQGGTRVTLVPQGEDPTQEQLNQARTILENRVNGMGVSGAEVITDGDTLVITVPGEDSGEARAVGQTSQLLFRPVDQAPQPDFGQYTERLGDMANRWVKYGVITKEEAEERIDSTLNVLNGQLDKVRETGQLPEGAGEIEAPEITAEPLDEPANSLEAQDRRQEVTEVLLKDRQSEDPTDQSAAMTLIDCTAETDPLAGTDDPAKPLVACHADDEQTVPLLLKPAPVLEGEENADDPERLTGNAIDTDQPIQGGYDPQTGEMQVSFSFAHGGGAETWAKLTQEYLQRQIAITLDSQILSAPVIQSATPVGSATRITGDFSQEEAQGLANNLRYGALPLSFAGEDGEPGGTEESIPASLGQSSLQAGLIAGAVGLLLIAIFVFAYYRLYGVISIVTLAAAAALVYGTLIVLGRLIGYSLDLSGIAGLIIGLGATADSFVVIYERIKDEVREGHSFRSATGRGWKRAKRTIVTGNIVTLIGSVVIYFLAVGQVKGFAFTLGMTTLFDLLVTYTITAPLMILAAQRPFWARPSVNGMGKVFKIAERNRRRRADQSSSEAAAGPIAVGAGGQTPPGASESGAPAPESEER